jgi:hypothetical protein
MVSKRWPWRRSTFREANRVSLDALSQQLPLRLIEAVMPHFRSRRLSDSSSVQFRTEMYNALNHPQFADPDNDFASPAFGVIRRTSVNPRVVQFALKLAF